MNIGCCFTGGLKRVLRSPALIIFIYATSVVIVLPLTVGVREAIKGSVGSSLVQENLRKGFDLDWYGEFVSQERGLGETFGPQVTGFLPTLKNIEKLLDGRILTNEFSLSLAGILFLAAWAFWGGGIISCYAQPETPTVRSSLFADAGKYFLPFVRLVILSVLLYLALYRWLASPLFRLIDRLTNDTPAEAPEMICSGLVYLLMAILLAVFSMAMDYAKIAMVTEQRRSAVLAFLRGLGFVLSNKLKTVGLYLCLVVVGIFLFALYGLLAPGPSQSGNFSLIAAFMFGQVFLIARLLLKLWFLGSQTVLFQSVIKPDSAQS
ncbi:MAG TPA: hypothetical protein VE398_20510 [Acidobacteriota bacterium]|nr:hypothetical protein [Acidobacteriota bacterium]